MAYRKTDNPLTPAEKQARYRERLALAQTQDSAIADAARILHGELLLNAGKSFVIPAQLPLENTATFIRRIADDLEHARRAAAKGARKTL